MKKLSTLDWVVLLIVALGGINWLLVGIFSFDLVAGIFGSSSVASRIVYIVVGLCAIYLVAISKQLTKK